MIIIGEKINGAIPSIKQAIAEKNEALIIERTLAQANSGAHFLDCAPSTATEIEYETMVWLIGLMQSATDVPLCIDSPNARLLARIIDKAVNYGVALSQLHIDPCVMALATMPSAMEDFAYCIRAIHEYAPEVKVTGAISNISFEMPARKYVNMNCLAYAMAAGLDSAILDPCNEAMMGTIYACDALRMADKGGRKYNRAHRKGLFGQKK